MEPCISAVETTRFTLCAEFDFEKVSGVGWKTSGVFSLGQKREGVILGTLEAMLLSLNNVDKYYGSQKILSGVSLGLEPRDRLALVGRNGAGKSTLLKLITGEEEPLSGGVWRARGIGIGLLRQSHAFSSDTSVEDVLESAFEELDRLETELESLNIRVQMEPENTALLETYHEALEHYQLRGGYERRSRRDAVSSAFGFRGREHEQVSRLSGGEKTRLALASILIGSPEVLLLDEPTNHLDMAMREWLEGFLSRYSGAMVLVSHDRAFLDAVANKTAYLRDGTLDIYSGNYTQFQQQWTAWVESQMAMFEQQQKKIDTLGQSAARMKIWGLGMAKLARRAKAMETRLERLKDAQIDLPDSEDEATEIHFDCESSGERVLEAAHLSQSFEGRDVFKDVSVSVRQGDRIAIIGPNGTGKTTLIKTLLGMLPSQNPRSQVRLGARVKVGYYDQQLRNVDPELTLFEEVRMLVDSDVQVRNLLGAFLFPYDRQSKRIKDLSGGEKARLALLKLSFEKNNLLILDEPTNHLDMEMLENLEEALDRFEGTLIIVSHDRAFIDRLANQIWVLEDGSFYSYPGGYSYYKLKHAVQKVEIPVQKGPEKPRRSGPSLWHLKRKVEELEKEIAQLEQQLLEAQRGLEAADPSADFATLGRNIADLEAHIERQMDAWLVVTTQISDLE